MDVDLTNLDAIKQMMDHRYATNQAYEAHLEFDRVRHNDLLDGVFELISRHGRPHIHTLLDVGCGEGSLMGEIKRRPILRAIESYHGIDISAEALKKFAIHHAGVMGMCTLHACPGEEHIPELDGQCDVIVGVEAVEHWFDHNAVLGRIVTYLKPDGLLVLTTPNTDSLHARMMRKLGAAPPKVSYDHVHEFGWAELDDVVCAHGLHRVGYSGAGFAPYWAMEEFIGGHLRHITDTDEEVNRWMSNLAKVCPEMAFCQIKAYMLG